MMKKILLGTSAIVGASVLLASPVWAAEKPKLEMNGYLRFEAWGVSQDQNVGSGAGENNKGFEFEMDDVEIHFQGSAKADNGLEYGFYVEMQEGSDSKIGYDEANVFLSGNWGRLDLGAQDAVQDTWKAGAYAIVADKDGAWDGNNTFNHINTHAYIGTDLLNGGDANKVTYYSPSFSGFQIGASFTPDFGKEENSGYSALSTASEARIGQTTGAHIVGDGRNNDYGIGVRYQGTVSGVGILVTGRYEGGQYTNFGATGEREDASAWGIGTQLTYMGFSFGASYQDLGDSGLLKTEKDAGADSGKWWDIGLAYGTGPYKVSVAYMNSKASNTNGLEDDEVDYYAFGASYAAAPGLDLYAEYQYVDIDAPSGGATNNNTANLFLLGTQVSF